MSTSAPDTPLLGVVIVSYASGDVVLDCLETLLASRDVRLVVVVVDNDSPDDTVTQIRDWAACRLDAPLSNLPFECVPAARPLAVSAAPPVVPADTGHSLAIIEAGENDGFAAGVNRGIAALAAIPAIDRFWVLNPDCAVPPGTAAAFARHSPPAGGFSLMGGRVIYLERPDSIQIDGGLIGRWTGVTGNANQYAAADSAPPDLARIDFITGASLVASRAFLQAAGPMPEDYFLYYEEVDWALRRGHLPLVWCPGGIVYHRAGTSIGSPAPGRRASRFSLYFKHRARLRFVLRYFPFAWPTAIAFSLAKALQSLLQGDPSAAATILGASLGFRPPAEVYARLKPAAAARALAPWRRKPYRK